MQENAKGDDRESSRKELFEVMTTLPFGERGDRVDAAATRCVYCWIGRRRGCDKTKTAGIDPAVLDCRRFTYSHNPRAEVVAFHGDLRGGGVGVEVGALGRRVRAVGLDALTHVVDDRAVADRGVVGVVVVFVVGANVAGHLGPFLLLA